jgi:hypothetical protein
LQLASERDLGFRLIAAPGAAGGGARGPFGLSPGEAEGQTRPAHRVGFKIGDLECGLPSGPGWRGNIERGGWQRATKIVLPAGYAQRPMIEIATSGVGVPAIVWGDGLFDWGRKLANNRVRFTRDDNADLGEITIIAPAAATTHVVVG